MDRRAELKLAYKQSVTPMGVIQIKNKINGKIFIASGPNMNGLLNRQKIQLDTSTHMNKELQREWKEYGEEAFSIEILEYLEGDDPQKDYRDDLKKLEEKWLEKLQPYGDAGYNKKK